MKKDTLLAHIGRNPSLYGGAVNPPIIQTSTVVFDSREEYQRAGRGEPIHAMSQMGDSSDFSYGTGGTPTSFALQEALRELEHGDGCALTSSGLSAITDTLHCLLQAGDHILVVDSVYGPTRRYCNKILNKYGVETEYYDPRLGEGIENLIRENTKIIFLESPGSQTFEVQDVPTICQIAKDNNIITILDNSWATPLFFTPLDHGVDIVIQAVTKYIGGHSDLLLGAVITKGQKLTKDVLNGVRNLGESPNPFACYLALRGLRSLSVRMQRHEENVMYVAPKVVGHAKVKKMLFPALESSEDYELWKKQFTGTASLFSLILDKRYDDVALARCMDECKIFSVGASWGGYESLVLDFDPRGSRTAMPWTEEGSCIRFYLGLEDKGDLLEDVLAALDRL